jgi:hypothetical protein
MNDRRRTGVNRVIIDDGNGGKREVINMSATWGKAHTILGVLVAIGTLLGGVFVAARTGVQIEVTDAIRVETQQDDGIIHREIHGCVEEMVEEVQAVFQDDLDIFEEEQQTIKETVIRLDERQIGVIEDVGENHEELMTELRALRDDN